MPRTKGAKQKLTTADVVERTGKTKQYIHQLRNGITKKVGDKTYKYPATLVQGEHYIWQDGKLYFFVEALKVIGERVEATTM